MPSQFPLNRSLPPPVDSQLDEPLLPVNIGLLLLGAVVAGLIIATGDFRTDNALHNAWIRLATLAVTTGLLLVAVTVGVKSARVLQAAVLCSLLIHLTLVFQSYSVPMPLPELHVSSASRAKSVTILRDLTTLSPAVVVHSSNPTTAKVSEIDRPVDAPARASQAPAVAKTDTQKLPNMPRPKVPAPEAPRDVVAPTIVPQRPEFAAPRRADQESRLSRSLAKVDLQPTERIRPAPDVSESSPARPVELAPTHTPAVQRQVAATQMPPKLDMPLAPAAPAAAKIPAAPATSEIKPPQLDPIAATLAKAAPHAAAAPKLEIDAPAMKFDGLAAGKLSPAASDAVKQKGEGGQPNGIAGPVLVDPARAGATPMEKPKTSDEQPRLAVAARPSSAKPAADIREAATHAIEPGKIPGLNVASSPHNDPSSAAPGPAAADVTHGTPLAGTATTFTLKPVLGIPGDASPTGAPLSAPQRGDRPEVGAGRPDLKPETAIARAQTFGKIPASAAPVDSPGLEIAGATPKEIAPLAPRLGKADSPAAGRLAGGGAANGGPLSIAPGTGAVADTVGVTASNLSRAPTATGGPSGPLVGTAGAPLTARAPAGSKLPTGYAAADQIVMANITGPGLGGANPNGAGDGRMGPGDLGGVQRSAATNSHGALAGKAIGLPGEVPGGGGVGAVGLVLGGSTGPGIGAAGNDRAPSVRVGVEGGAVARASGGGPAIAGIASDVRAAVPQAPNGDGSGGDASPQASDKAAVTVRSGGGGLGTATLGSIAGPLGGSLGGTGSGSAGMPDGTVDGAGGGNIVGALAGRAAAGEGVPGGVVGGDNGGLVRSASPVVLGTGTAIDAPRVPLADAGSHLPPSPVAVDRTADGRGFEPARNGGGATGLKGLREIGGGSTLPSGGDVAVAGSIGTAGGIPEGLRGSEGKADAPTVMAGGVIGPQRSATGSVAIGGTADQIAAPAFVRGGPGGTAGAIGGGTNGVAGGDYDAGPQPLEVGRGSGSGGGGGANVPLAALAGAGGLGEELTPSVGSLSRQARLESEVVHVGGGRFLQRAASSPVVVEGRVRETASAYGGRIRRPGERDPSGEGRPPSEADRAIERGLEFLARGQQPEGNWSLRQFPGATADDEGSIDSDAAATGLALLAFLGAGYDHYDGAYRDTVQSALDFLVQHQRADGNLYVVRDSDPNVYAQFYSHAIGALALSEAYGMTGDKKLREPAQKALDFIVKSQMPQLGGWRYVPQVGSDTSVTGWQIMALKSGELAKLKVPRETYQRARGWLDQAQASASDASQYRYNPRAADQPETRDGLRPNTTMTAVGLLTRIYLGWPHDEPALTKGAARLKANLPDAKNRDTYYWYYATQVMFHSGGEQWKAWSERLYPILLNSQTQNGAMKGSWNPRGPTPDKWGVHGGRIYVTTMNLLSLEVNLRHLQFYDTENITPATKR